MSKNILVAGGAGYIGSHTCKALAKAGYTPIVIDDLSTGFEKAVKWGPLHLANINDPVVSTIIKDNDIKSVIHFAASSQVAESVQNPDKYFTNNVENSCLFLKTCIDAGVENFIFSSTAAVYGNPKEPRLLNEEDELKPINPYGDSKMAFETILREEAPKYATGKFNSIVLRYFNACGADADGEIGEDHDPETHLIPLVCKAGLAQENVKVFGNDYKTPDGTAIRDYVDVADLADAHIRSLEAIIGGMESQTFNVGSGCGYSVMEVCRQVAAIIPDLRGENRPRREGDPAVLVADIKKIKETIGWEPKTPLSQSVANALEWEKRKQL